MTVSIIIPVYNEQDIVRSVLKKVKSLDFYDKIIIVDDGSTDASREIIEEEFGNEKFCKLIYHANNQGKGAALRTAIQSVDTDVFIIQDADLEYEPQEYKKLLQPILNNTAQVVYGSRFKDGDPIVKYPLFLFGNRFLTFLINVLYGTHLTDVMTCYKVIKTSLVKNMVLNSNGFEVEVELTSKLLKKNVVIQELPISYQSRSYQEGKKIRWWDGVLCIGMIFKIRCRK